jgi:hypothetical protein
MGDAQVPRGEILRRAALPVRQSRAAPDRRHHARLFVRIPLAGGEAIWNQIVEPV